MTNLIDRIAKDNPDLTDPIAVHTLSSAIFKYGEGEWDANKIHIEFNMDASAIAQMNQILADFDSGNAKKQAAYRDKLESNAILLEVGKIDKTEFETVMGIV